MIEFHNQVALVTGAGRGMGREFALLSATCNGCRGPAAAPVRFELPA